VSSDYYPHPHTHTIAYASSYGYISSGLVLLNMCPHTTRYLMASCCCICQWGRRVRGRGTGHARCSTGSSRSHPVLARDAGRELCFAGSSTSHKVPARDAEWAAVGVRESGKALRRFPAFNGDLLCSDQCVTVIHLCRLRGVTEALLTSALGSGFRSGNRRQSGGPMCVPCPLGSYKGGVG
jgi:hypothetical protein